MRSADQGSLAETSAAELELAHERFARSTALLTEELSNFAPASGMMTTAQQVAHTARVVDWFMEGAFRPQGFDMDFDSQIAQVLAIDSLSTARLWLDRSFANAIAILGSKTDAELLASLPPGPVMEGQPRSAIIPAIVDHTAHHRGALTIYSRLNQIQPPDPYGM